MDLRRIGKFRSTALVLLSLFYLTMAGCGGGGGGASTATNGSITADASGSVAAGTMVNAPAGVSIAFDQNLVTTLTDGGSNPVTGAITTTVTSSTSAGSLPAAAPGGNSLAILLDIDMSAGATQVKNINPPLTVVVPVPAGVTSVDIYSFDGTNWVIEQANVAVSGGTATFNISHLSIWAAFSVPALTISTTSLADATAGTAYSQTLAATGGTAPHTWSVSTGTLPAGLTLNASTGVVSGTPTAAGTSNFEITVTDSASRSASQTLSITVTAAPAALTITTTSLLGGTVGTAYSQTLTASGGTAPYTWTLSTGSLPAGLTLNVGTGVISGTPSAAATANFTVMVTDAASATATHGLSIVVAAPTIDGAALYTQYCFICHGNNLGPRTAGQITTAINSFNAMSQFRAGGATPLTAEQVAAIAASL